MTPTRPRDRFFVLSRRKRQWLTTCALLITDFMAIGAALWLAFQLRFIWLPYTAAFDIVTYQSLVLGMILSGLVIFAVFQLYNPHLLFGGTQEYSRAFNAITAGSVILTIISFLRRDDLTVSRGWVILSWIFSLMFVIGARFMFRRVVYALRKRGYFQTPTLIIGANNEGRALADQFAQQPTSGLSVAGFIDSNKPLGSHVTNGYKIIGGLDTLEQVVVRENIEEVVIAPTALNREELIDIFRTLNPILDVNIRLSSGLFEILNTGLRVKELAAVPLIEVTKSRTSGLDAVIKWLIDYVGALFILLLIWPILLIIYIYIRLDSKGPAIYRRRVMGTNGTQFDAFKFRTMHANGDEILAAYPDLEIQLQQDHKLKEDPRITRFGNTLRRYSLDELPQFFNVLLGQMSLVGPRMISPPEMDQYGKWATNLLTVKPGITGLWQISGRSDVSYEERVKLDMYYIRNWSLWVDVYILLNTIPAVLKKKGAY